jgi:hypothetical protein
MMFDNFFFAGFEGTTGYNKHNQWIDEVSLTQHDIFVRADYSQLRSLGIRGVRESIRWPLIDSGRRYDFSTLRPVIEAAEEFGMEVLYDLFHFGYPVGLDLFSPDFPRRFADYCEASAGYIAKHAASFHFAPVNEPSFFAWAGGEVGLFAPHSTGRGAELKIRLIEAAIQGINAIWSACPEASIVNIDPICRVAAPPGGSLSEDHAAVAFNEIAVFEAWDMLSGRLHPELGGSPEHLCTIGVNYYWTNQWELGNPGALADDDERRWPLSKLLKLVWDRYGHQLSVTETGHIGDNRANWLVELVHECEAALAEGTQIKSVCLYPILGMQEWHSLGEFVPMGMWDLVSNDNIKQRVPFAPMIDAFSKACRLEKGKQGITRTTPGDKSSVAGIG